MKNNWKKTVYCIIVTDLLLCGFVQIAHAADSPGPKPESSVEIRLKPKDAARVRVIADLEREKASAKDALRKLEERVREGIALEQIRKRELLELMKKYQERDDSNRQLQLLMSGLNAASLRKVGIREEQLSEQLRRERALGGTLALEAVAFSELAERCIVDWEQGKAPDPRLALASESLRKLGRRFIVMTADGEKSRELERCRILAVNSKLSFVLLPVGIRQGAFNGLVYRTGKGTTTLRIVGVRPDVAAAVVVSGSMDDLAPGMEVATESTRE